MSQIDRRSMLRTVIGAAVGAIAAPLLPAPAAPPTAAPFPWPRSVYRYFRMTSESKGMTIVLTSISMEEVANEYLKDGGARIVRVGPLKGFRVAHA